MMLVVGVEAVEDGVGEGGVFDGSGPVGDGCLKSPSIGFSSDGAGARDRDTGDMGSRLWVVWVFLGPLAGLPVGQTGMSAS